MFSNTVSGEGFTTTTGTVVFTGGGGTGEGSGLGAFSVVKAVTGDGAGLVPSSLQYTVSYAYTDADGAPATGTLNLATGAAQTLSALPDGTVVTLTETTPPTVEGITWGTPVFSGEGITPTPEGAQLTITEDTTIAVTLTNPTTTTPPGTPAVPTGGLALTGAPLGGAAALATAFALLGTALITTTRRWIWRK